MTPDQAGKMEMPSTQDQLAIHLKDNETEAQNGERTYQLYPAAEPELKPEYR